MHAVGLAAMITLFSVVTYIHRESKKEKQHTVVDIFDKY